MQSAPKILHVHPLVKCNLKCLHCYSSSSPQRREILDIKLLQQAIADASREGYEILSVSGGEPLLYEALADLLGTARQHQMRTSIVSNGILLNKSRLDKLQGLADIIAISLDGKPELHDRMRNRSGAFRSMTAKLENLRHSGIPFGFVFTVSKYNFRDLEWAVNFAVEQQASLIRFHLLEEIGRAKHNLTNVELNEQIAAYVYLQTIKLQAKFADRIRINLDLAHQSSLQENRRFFYSSVAPFFAIDLPLAELVSPLVIETDGTVVPIQHGISRKYALGNLKQENLSQLATKWREEKYPDFLRLCDRTYHNLILDREFPIRNWYRELFIAAASPEVALA